MDYNIDTQVTKAANAALKTIKTIIWCKRFS